jgi:hypothetical protein
MVDWINIAPRGGGDSSHDLREHGPWWNLGLPRLVFSLEPVLVHRRTEALEQFNCDTRLLLLGQDEVERPPTRDALAGGGRRRCRGQRWPGSAS